MTDLEEMIANAEEKHIGDAYYVQGSKLLPLLRELQQARETLAKLPKTADGVPEPLWKGGEVFHPTDPHHAYHLSPSDEDAKPGEVSYYLGCNEWLRVPLKECYSTRESALAAKGKGEVKP